MQQTIFDLSDTPWILQRSSFSHSSFWQEDFLNISNHLPVNLPMSIGQLDPIKYLIFADNTLDDIIIQF